MIDWMVRSAAAGVLIALATWLGSLALGWLGRPRRWAGAGGLAAAALMPFLGLLLPARPAPAPAAALSPGDVAALLAGNASGTGAAAGSSLPGWLPGVIWAVASLLLLLEQGYALRRLARLRRGWTPALLDGLEVLIAERVGPAVLGVLKPAVVVPPWLVAAPARERGLALAHECEHVRAGDTRLLAAGTLASTLLPWSPALWWLQRRLRDAVETDCDARVLAAGCDVVAYGRMLVEAAGRPGRPLARVALVERRNQLERRIRAMKSQLPSRPLARAAAMAVGMIALVAAACELSSPPPAPTETRPASPKQAYATVADEPPLVATDTGEIRRIIVDDVPGGRRTRLIHKDGRVEVRMSYPKRPFPDSATAYAAGYAAGKLAAEEHMKVRTATVDTFVAGGRGRGEGRGIAVGHGQSVAPAQATGASEALHVREVVPFMAQPGTPRTVVVVDGRASSMEAIKALDPENIQAMNVVKVKVAGVPDTIYIRTR